MKMKKLTALFLTATLTLSAFAGCGGSKGGDTKETGSANAGTGTSTEATDTASGEEMVIEVFDAAANYQGEQTGWFAKVIKDRFNIKLNIIAPQVAGASIYQTRASSGNLGDIILLDPTDFTDCISAGLIKDISADVKNCSNLMAFQDQIDTYNKGIPGNNGGAIYGIPCEMTNTSPTTISADVIYSSPMTRWDLYKEAGMPDLNNLDDFLDLLEKIQAAHPTNADGDPAYAFSLWPDWDGNDGMIGIANVVQLTTWYGEKIKGSAILRPDNTFTEILDKNASYYKITKFLYKANQRGLVDPDSGTQDWNAACAKMSAGQVYVFWYSWQVGFWNTQDRLKDGTAMIYIPIKDQKYYADSDTYYGSGRVIGVGASVDDAKYQTIMKFLDWYASPEGVVFQHDGIEGFNYTKDASGKFTIMNDNALMDNLPVPEEYGGAGYSDGNNQINQWIVAAISTNPESGETYSSQYWSSYKAATMTEMKKEWADKFGAAEPVEYMKKNNMLVVSPSVSVSLASDTAEIGIIRNQCNTELCDASWRMILTAKDDADFDKQWDEMVEKMKGMNFDELYKFDCEKHQVEVDAKVAAAK